MLVKLLGVFVNGCWIIADTVSLLICKCSLRILNSIPFEFYVKIITHFYSICYLSLIEQVLTSHQ